MPRTQYGDRRACKHCGQDIEFHGAKVGWIDRGADRMCALLPDPDPHDRGAWIKPKRRTLHKPEKD